MSNQATRLAEARAKIAKAIRKAEGQGCQSWPSTQAMRDALAAIDALAAPVSNRVIVMAPPPSGGDDTANLQAAVDLATALAQPAGSEDGEARG